MCAISLAICVFLCTYCVSLQHSLCHSLSLSLFSVCCFMPVSLFLFATVCVPYFSNCVLSFLFPPPPPIPFFRQDGVGTNGIREVLQDGG